MTLESTARVIDNTTVKLPAPTAWASGPYPSHTVMDVRPLRHRLGQHPALYSDEVVHPLFIWPIKPSPGVAHGRRTQRR